MRGKTPRQVSYTAPMQKLQKNKKDVAFPILSPSEPTYSLIEGSLDKIEAQ